MARHIDPLTRFIRDGIVYYRIRRNDGSYVRRSTYIFDSDKQKRSKETAWIAANLELIRLESSIEKAKAQAREKLLFRDLAHDFYAEGSDYLKVRKDANIDFKRSSMDANQSYLDNHVLPYFGEKRLSQITVTMIDEWLSVLAKKEVHTGGSKTLSPSTRKHCLQVLNNVLNEAVRKKLLDENPAKRSIGVQASGKKKKRIMTQEELRTLFLMENSLELYWGNKLRFYVISLMAAVTGARQSELLGLQLKHIHGDHFDIEQNYYREYGKTSPKTEASIRCVPLFDVFKDSLKLLISSNPYGQDPEYYVFYGETKNKPMSYTTINVALIEAYKKIGISNADQKTRMLTFHALRNFADTYMAAIEIPVVIIQAILGHKSQNMTEYYLQYNPDFFADIPARVNEWFDRVKNGKDSESKDSKDSKSTN